MGNKGKTWRDSARPIIHRVLKEQEGSDEATIKQALYEAYPFGQRKYHPYKIWLDEIRVQRKLKAFGKKNKLADPNQQNLF
jgi:hypothetical protein